MTASVEINKVELDPRASTATQPYGIITADCSDPKEIDDGIFVESLPDAQETYRVGVCVVDTSKLYNDKDIFEQALKNVHARYWELPNKERGYEPMLDLEAIRELEFKKGQTRNALVVSFIVGEKQPPSGLDVSFGKVEVTENLDYKSFAKRCRSNEEDKKFGRASAFILRHLQYTSGGDYDSPSAADDTIETIYQRMVDAPRSIWLRGAWLNEAYMVGANHLVGLMMAAENRPAIYRVHDPDDETYLEFIPPDLATYSRKPGRHAGLNLEPYCRVTSPLRRLEDFMMSYQLKQRYLGHTATTKDARDVAAAVQCLNRHIAREVDEGPLRLSRRDTLGRSARRALETFNNPAASQLHLVQEPEAVNS